ncbi:MAG: hypothetical protein AAF108_12060 [Planctomycetota bacterium]
MLPAPPRARAGGSTARAAFSILELLVSLAILVLVAGVVLPPVFSSFRRGLVGQTVRAVEDGLAETRAEALRTGRPWRLEMRPEGKVWTLWQVELDRLEPEEDPGEPGSQRGFGRGFGRVFETGARPARVGSVGASSPDALATESVPFETGSSASGGRSRRLAGLPRGLLAPVEPAAIEGSDRNGAEPDVLGIDGARSSGVIVLAIVSGDASTRPVSGVRLTDAAADAELLFSQSGRADLRAGESGSDDVRRAAEPLVLRVERGSGRVLIEAARAGVPTDDALSDEVRTDNALRPPAFLPGARLLQDQSEPVLRNALGDTP